MSLTITVHDPLAGLLQSRAEVEKIAVAELALRLLESGVQNSSNEERWLESNRRRTFLIEKRFDSRLTDYEEVELEQLQELADRRIEELDRAMLDGVSRMEAAAKTTPCGNEGSVN